MPRMKRDDPNRIAAEAIFFGEGTKSVLATNGEERTMRNVKIDVWRSYFARFGMVEAELSTASLYHADLVAKKFSCGNSCTLDLNGKALTIGWKGNLMSESAVEMDPAAASAYTVGAQHESRVDDSEGSDAAVVKEDNSSIAKVAPSAKAIGTELGVLPVRQHETEESSVLLKQSFRDIMAAQGQQDNTAVDQGEWDDVEYEEGDISFVDGKYGRAIELSAAFEKRLDHSWQHAMIIMNFSLSVQPWYTDFQASEGKVNRANVWVRFLEVDLLKPLRGKVDMQGKEWLVEYEGLSIVCYNCGSVDHCMAACPLLYGVEGSHQDMIVQPQDSDQIIQPPRNIPQMADKGVGEWMNAPVFGQRRGQRVAGVPYVALQGAVTGEVITSSRFDILHVVNEEDDSTNGNLCYSNVSSTASQEQLAS
ncbi:hypothetical protein Tsubulata_046094 [Turnera subulata]|uniref:Zinc knuckle CX2CX4HX4C domain-containing protein n=1 Tax=Turnera subulata TaxID=218843 RepID=A0A9Q0FTS5_9ROSI|nr:hypothetical protein Tsubulata_046094 [Turnera subulata]